MSKNKWISVKDHLPPIDENVLCYVKGKIFIDLLVHSDMCYLHSTGKDAHNYIKNNTTHWRELPDVPKEIKN